jgi:hypothetical protein
MGLKCNIDAVGKKARLVNGIGAVVIGLLIGVFWGFVGGSNTGWAVAAALLAAGGFMIFEARAGWCVLRAMGIWTKI